MTICSFLAAAMLASVASAELPVPDECQEPIAIMDIDYDLANEPGSRSSMFQYAVLYIGPEAIRPAVVPSDIRFQPEWRDEKQFDLGNGFYLTPLRLTIESTFGQSPPTTNWT